MEKDKKIIEKEVFDKMTLIYCKGHKHKDPLCDDCKKIVEYAHKRIDNCRLGDEKTFCSKCTIHCFKEDIRNDVKKIMSYSGPRMIFHHPIMAIKHLFA